jgi:hypothetical protein
MIELHEIEELTKTVNRGAIKAFLRNAAILRDPNASPEMKELAEANVRAIAYNQPIPKPKADKPAKQKKPKAAAAAEQATQIITQRAPQTPAAAATQMKPSPKMEFHEEFARHHGIDPANFKATWHAMTPEQQKITKQWHAEQTAAPKMAKSIDKLYNLFSELKKHL